VNRFLFIIVLLYAVSFLRTAAFTAPAHPLTQTTRKLKGIDSAMVFFFEVAVQFQKNHHGETEKESWQKLSRINKGQLFLHTFGVASNFARIRSDWRQSFFSPCLGSGFY
jgi:hypothetical protein